ncbi:nucleotide exchange factor GrpE [Marseilla massiliensis]|jgi:molecular chaperone GrpE|uniref:nucleotide exchange factor GrpE n=1 Tax=Marseilla massiliensis TaxID=1841864 RepID=UPI001F8B39A1|nr:nucleotide exchange factor GrpE [Prevotella sp.]HIV84240.1 nucleotide exchange factor GrpE [Candidatus Prevotella intestinigallinarum]
MEEKEKEIEIENGDEKVCEEQAGVNGDETAASQTENETTADEKEAEKSPLDVANEQIAELKDKYLRSVAEFDNYRKRTLKEKAELILNGGEKAISAILPVLDDMERAIANGEKTEDPKVLREGMELIYAKFQKVLEGLGVKKIDTEDADFDTDVHEAVAMVPGMGDDKKGKVLDCIQTGYMLNEKVIRHAKVAVGQ